jgi:hypothetical protein
MNIGPKLPHLSSPASNPLKNFQGGGEQTVNDTCPPSIGTFKVGSQTCDRY